MRGSLRWTLHASAHRALALSVAACGGSNNTNTSGGAANTTGGTDKQVGQEGRRRSPYLASGDVD